MTIPNRLPGVTYAQLPVTASRAAALSLPPRLVVIHDTSNSASAQAEASYAASRSLDGATSAHFYVDGMGPLGSLPLNLQAWAAYSYANSHGWHIEMCGYNAGMPGAVPAKTIAITAGLVRQLCDLAAIPIVKLSPADVAEGKRGICGHWDITTGLGVGTHDDPGPKFDWPAFIAAVKGDDDMDTPVAWNTGWIVQRLAENADPIVIPPNAEIGAPGAKIPNALARKLAGLDVELDTVRDALGKLATPAAAPVDPTALKAVLLDPDVLKALAKAVNDDAAARLES